MTMQWWFAGSEDHVYVLAVVTPRRSESSKHERLEWERWLWLHFGSCFGKSKPLTQGACYCSQQRVYRSSEFSDWIRLRPNKLLCVHYSRFNSPHHSPNPNLGNGTKTNVSSGTKTLCHEGLWNPGCFEQRPTRIKNPYTKHHKTTIIVQGRPSQFRKMSIPPLNQRKKMICLYIIIYSSYVDRQGSTDNLLHPLDSSQPQVLVAKSCKASCKRPTMLGTRQAALYKVSLGLQTACSLNEFRFGMSIFSSNVSSNLKAATFKGTFTAN